MKCHVAVAMENKHKIEPTTYFYAFSMCHLHRCSSPTACIHSSGVRELLPCSDPVNSIRDPQANLNVQCMCSSVLWTSVHCTSIGHS